MEATLQNPRFSWLPACWVALETTSVSHVEKPDAGEYVSPTACTLGSYKKSINPSVSVPPKQSLGRDKQARAAAAQNHCCWAVEEIHQPFRESGKKF